MNTSRLMRLAGLVLAGAVALGGPLAASDIPPPSISDDSGASRIVFVPVVLDNDVAALPPPVTVSLSTDRYDVDVSDDDTFNVFVTVANTGAAPVDGVTVQLRYDADRADLVSWPAETVFIGGGQVTLDLDDPLDPGGQLVEKLVFEAEDSTSGDVLSFSGSFSLDDGSGSGATNSASVRVQSDLPAPGGSFSCATDGVHGPLGVQPATGRGGAGTEFVFAAFDSICGWNFSDGETVSLWTNDPDGGVQPLGQVIADGQGDMEYRLRTGGYTTGCYGMVASSQDQRYQLVGPFIIDPTTCAGQGASAAQPPAGAGQPALSGARGGVAGQDLTSALDGVWLARGGLRGRVTGEGGEPLGGVLVAVRDGGSGAILSSAVTGADGGYVIPAGLPSGAHRVVFASAQSSTPASAAYATETLPVQIAEPQIARLDAALERGAPITGRVTADESGAGIASVAALVYDASGGLLAEATTGSDGRYATPALPDGAYTLVFEPGRSTRAAAGAYLREQLPAPVALDAPSPASADISLGRCAACGQLSGRVTDQRSGLGLTGISVAVQQADGGLAALTTTDTAGTYDVVLPTGVYTVTFFADYAPTADARRAVDGVYAGGPVQVTAPSVRSGIDAAVQPGAQVRGRVTGASGGAGLPGIMVSVSDVQGRFITSAVSDKDGSYATPGLDAGSYRLAFSPAQGSSSAGYAERVVTVTLGAAELRGGVDVALSR